MKNWLLYFFAVMISVVSVPVAAEKVFPDKHAPAITVFLDGNITEMTCEEYAKRILLAEGNNCRTEEGRKALAVSARSIAYYLSVYGCKHEEFDACDNAQCCFALGDLRSAEEDILNQWDSALSETTGLVLTIDSFPAMALFTQCAGSGTGDCEEFPYLTAVAEENPCQIHIREAIHDYSALAAVLTREFDPESIRENSILVYGDNQKCLFGIIGGEYAESLSIKQTLGLDSGEFTLEFGENEIKSFCRGIGHGYGLSVCGGDNMADSGRNFEEILKNFYPDLILKKLYNN